LRRCVSLGELVGQFDTLHSQCPRLIAQPGNHAQHQLFVETVQRIVHHFHPRRVAIHDLISHSVDCATDDVIDKAASNCPAPIVQRGAILA
jgi:hypothetical protein